MEWGLSLGYRAGGFSTSAPVDVVCSGSAGELDGIGDLLWTALRKGRYNGLDLM